jgi:hypothetical protein
MTVTYEDNTTKVVDVAESMFSETDKEKLKNVEQYNLTVNYGDKTTTMYANVVDERYLLKEVVEENLDKDITLTVGNNTCQIDADNKIIKWTSETSGYVWLSNNITYNYETSDGCYKGLVSDWRENSRMYHTMDVLDILETGKDCDGGAWTIKSVEKDGINYVLTVDSAEGGMTKKYTFNDDFLLSIRSIDLDSNDEIESDVMYEYNYSPITLEVPTEIKSLENSATVHIASRIEDLKSTMAKYLESDLEVITFDIETSSNIATTKYDTDNNIVYYEDKEFNKWYWTNGDYWYSKESDSDRAHKENISSWKDCVIECIFGEIDYNGENSEIKVSSDGQHYELITTVEDYPDSWEYKYIFNDNEISKVEVIYNGQYMGYYTYNKTNIILEVPAEIKVLESSAQ